MHNYTTKIRNHEKKWVQMQDTGDELAIKRPISIHIDLKQSQYIQTLISKL